MSILQVIDQRKASRALDSKPIDKEILLRLAEAAHTAPSSMNNQPWRFVTVTDPNQLDALKKTLSPGNYWALKAPAITAVVTNPKWGMTLGNREYAYFEVGMATMAYQIQAVSEGLYVHTIAGFNADAAKETLGISAEDTIEVLVILAYPGSDSELNEKHKEAEHAQRKRLPLEAVLAFDAWTEELRPKPKA